MADSGARRGGRRPGHTNQIRIVGGTYRGRKLRFPSLDGLRPTSDRTRETLFNWLAPVVQGARCLDLFAGSGALGFEALSRGASEVVMIDRSAAAVSMLRQNADALGAAGLKVLQQDALNWLQHADVVPFDIIFLDPPFAGRLLDRCAGVLQQRHWLLPGGLVYLEADRTDGLPNLPGGWETSRKKQAGEVIYCLCQAAV